MARRSYSRLGRALNLLAAAAVLSSLCAHARGQDPDEPPPPQCDTPDDFYKEMLARCSRDEVNKGIGGGRCCYALGTLFKDDSICICQVIWENDNQSNKTFSKWSDLFLYCSEGERDLISTCTF